MSIEQTILDNLQKLPLEKQEEVLDFIEFLRQKNKPSSESKSPQQRAKAWREFTSRQLRDTPGLPAEALSRETMYE
jgi:hypothetical protein